MYYYPRTIRTIIIALCDVFDNIVVYNYENPVSGTTSAGDRLSVPIMFGPADKKYVSRKEEEQHKRYYSMIPRIGLVLKNFEYDSERATGAHEYREFHDDTISINDVDSFFKDIQPSPYNLNFDMQIKTNSMDHVCQIVEQILPYFNPSLDLRVKEFSFLNIEKNLKVLLNGVNLDFQEELTENDRREINISIGLTVKAKFYKRYTTSSIIKFITSRYYINEANTLTNIQSISASPNNILTETFRTSGYDSLSVSAFPNPSQYETSGFNPLSDIYFFTSGTSYAQNN